MFLREGFEMAVGGAICNGREGSLQLVRRANILKVISRRGRTPDSGLYTKQSFRKKSTTLCAQKRLPDNTDKTINGRLMRESGVNFSTILDHGSTPTINEHEVFDTIVMEGCAARAFQKLI